jgi:hypothetical protein
VYLKTERHPMRRRFLFLNKRFLIVIILLNGSGLKEVGDFGAQNCQPTTKLY